MAGGRTRVLIALALYVALMASAATSLYDPLENGDDDSSALVLLYVAAHVGLGVGVARAWVLAVPVIPGLIGFAITVADDPFGAWSGLILGVPVAVIATAIGWFIGKRLGAQLVPVMAAMFVVATVPAAWAGYEQIKRSSAAHLPRAVQRELPIDESLASDCEGDRGVDASGRALLRELDRNPDALVTYTYYYSDGPDPETRDITVRELAEEALSDLRSNPGCRSELRHRLEDALGV
jgi:hypothetical protein